MADFPSVGIQKITMRLSSVTAVAESPFTYEQQVYQHQGVRWEAEVKLSPLTRANAKTVEAFLAGLRGQATTFTLGNPLHNVSGGAGDATAATIGATTLTGTLSGGATVGDYFQLGTRLHIVTAVNSGGGTVTIMPPVRDTVSSSTAMDFTLPKGVWRLASNQIEWDTNVAGIYGFTFACVEAI
jgi:hypothetical protein